MFIRILIEKGEENKEEREVISDSIYSSLEQVDAFIDGVNQLYGETIDTQNK